MQPPTYSGAIKLYEACACHKWICIDVMLVPLKIIKGCESRTVPGQVEPFHCRVGHVFMMSCGKKKHFYRNPAELLIPRKANDRACTNVKRYLYNFAQTAPSIGSHNKPFGSFMPPFWAGAKTSANELL